MINYRNNYTKVRVRSDKNKCDSDFDSGGCGDGPGKTNFL